MINIVEFGDFTCSSIDKLSLRGIATRFVLLFIAAIASGCATGLEQRESQSSEEDLRIHQNMLFSDLCDRYFNGDEVFNKEKESVPDKCIDAYMSLELDFGIANVEEQVTPIDEIMDYGQTEEGFKFYEEVLWPAIQCIARDLHGGRYVEVVLLHSHPDKRNMIFTRSEGRAAFEDGTPIESTGTILINTDMMSNLSRSRLGGEGAALAMLAHEYVHIDQFATLGESSLAKLSSRMEDHADFMAGWYLYYLQSTGCTHDLDPLTEEGKEFEDLPELRPDRKTVDILDVALTVSEFGSDADPEELVQGNAGTRAANIFAGYMIGKNQDKLTQKEINKFQTLQDIGYSPSPEFFNYIGAEAFATAASSLLNVAPSERYDGLSINVSRIALGASLYYEFVDPEIGEANYIENGHINKNEIDKHLQRYRRLFVDILFGDDELTDRAFPL